MAISEKDKRKIGLNSRIVVDIQGKDYLGKVKMITGRGVTVSTCMGYKFVKWVNVLGVEERSKNFRFNIGDYVISKEGKIEGVLVTSENQKEISEVKRFKKYRLKEEIFKEKIVIVACDIFMVEALWNYGEKRGVKAGEKSLIEKEMTFCPLSGLTVYSFNDFELKVDKEYRFKENHYSVIYFWDAIEEVRDEKVKKEEIEEIVEEEVEYRFSKEKVEINDFLSNNIKVLKNEFKAWCFDNKIFVEEIESESEEGKKLLKMITSPDKKEWLQEAIKNGDIIEDSFEIGDSIELIRKGELVIYFLCLISKNKVGLLTSEGILFKVFEVEDSRRIKREEIQKCLNRDFRKVKSEELLFLLSWRKDEKV